MSWALAITAFFGLCVFLYGLYLGRQLKHDQKNK